MKVNVTVWTLASDDDSGTRAAVYATEHEVWEDYFSCVFSDGDDVYDDAKRNAARAALDARDYDELSDLGQAYSEGSFDTYSVDSQTLEIEATATESHN